MHDRKLKLVEQLKIGGTAWIYAIYILWTDLQSMPFVSTYHAKFYCEQFILREYC